MFNKITEINNYLAIAMFRCTIYCIHTVKILIFINYCLRYIYFYHLILHQYTLDERKMSFIPFIQSIKITGTPCRLIKYKYDIIMSILIFTEILFHNRQSRIKIMTKSYQRIIELNKTQPYVIFINL